MEGERDDDSNVWNVPTAPDPGGPPGRRGSVLPRWGGGIAQAEDDPGEQGGQEFIERPDPPLVRSGSAKSNCTRILEAGYAPYHYVLLFGNWWYWPGYEGPEGARMSSIWGSVPECRMIPLGHHKDTGELVLATLDPPAAGSSGAVVTAANGSGDQGQNGGSGDQGQVGLQVPINQPLIEQPTEQPTVAVVPKDPNSPNNLRQKPGYLPTYYAPNNGGVFVDPRRIKWVTLTPIVSRDPNINGRVRVMYGTEDDPQHACIAVSGATVTWQCPFYGERTPLTDDPITKTVKTWVVPYAPGSTDLWKVYKKTTLVRTYDSGGTRTFTTTEYKVVEGGRPGGAGSEEEAKEEPKNAPHHSEVRAITDAPETPPPPPYNPHTYKPGNEVPDPNTYQGGYSCLTDCDASEELWRQQRRQYLNNR